MSAATSSRFTGRHMTAILVAVFAIVITVNVLMATLASTTFGGVVVENSYVASQHFNRWLDEAAAEKALGWHAQTARTANDHLSIKLSGLSSGTVLLAAIARHPLGRAPDRSLTFVKQADGAFLSVERLPPGRWRLRLEVTTHDRLWRTEGDVQ